MDDVRNTRLSAVVRILKKPFAVIDVIHCVYPPIALRVRELKPKGNSLRLAFLRPPTFYISIASSIESDQYKYTPHDEAR